MVLTFEQIKELVELVAERGLRGLEIERSGFKLKVDGASTASSEAVAEETVAPPAPSSVGPATVAERSAAAEPAEPAEAALPADTHVIKSPIVGTFYAAPSPEADPYVRVGDRVTKGQVLCIVEAMKLMNEIESDVDGVVLEIYPKNAQPVEFEEPIFAIRPG